jgi:hypothetical protein
VSGSPFAQRSTSLRISTGSCHPRVVRTVNHRHDFQAFELLRIVERFAVGFHELPMLIPGRPDYRILIAAGALVPRLAVVGQLASDGADELVQLDIDLESDW